jgi:hypothetical protein
MEAWKPYRNTKNHKRLCQNIMFGLESRNIRFESIYAIFQITEEQLNAFIELFNLDGVSAFNGKKPV